MRTNHMHDTHDTRPRTLSALFLGVAFLALVALTLSSCSGGGGRRGYGRITSPGPITAPVAPAGSGTNLGSGDAVSANNTIHACRQAGHGEVAEALVGGMNFNAMRILRKMCATRGVDDAQLRQTAAQLGTMRLNDNQVKAYEALSDMPGFDASHMHSGLDAVSTLTFPAGQTFRNFAGMRGATVDQAIRMIPRMNEASALVNKAARAFFGIRGMDVDTADRALPTIAQMRKRQAEAVIAFSELPTMDPQTAVQGLELIKRMDSVNAFTATALFKNKEVSGAEAYHWLKTYFALTPSQQEAYYDGLDSRQKSVLLKGLYDGAEEAIWKINDLHAVTNDNGYEYSAAALNRMGARDLQYLFSRLDPVTRGRFAGAFGGGSVAVLRQATSAARSQAARDLPTAQMYVVMAQGSELYDSSFRDIIVPVMKDRIAKRSGGNLLNFLRQIDPESRFVSDFISATAQKGKLTAFFPQDAGQQREILNLVANSAFQNPDSVLLFSATFSHLLKALTPGARSHLINLMAHQTQSRDQHTSTLVRVILQYYAQSYPHLLGQDDRVQIGRLLAREGAVNLDRYQATPFNEWKSDGRIASLSMYHPDDDGRQSFASNASLLMRAGYHIESAPQYSIGGTCGTGGELGGIFSVMRNRRCAISFVKNVNGIKIVHSQFIYADKDTQKELLKRFIKSGDEMLAQRGHSYWRSEQIIEPLQELIKDGEVSPQELRGKRRFLSLGSCGGVKAYTTLTRLFEGSVDLLASIGTGLAMINDPYNKTFCEVAASDGNVTWQQMAQRTASIFSGERGQDYLQPGSLTAILHKILDEAGVRGNIGSQMTSQQRAQQRNQQAQQQSGQPFWRQWFGGGNADDGAARRPDNQQAMQRRGGNRPFWQDWFGPKEEPVYTPQNAGARQAP